MKKPILKFKLINFSLFGPLCLLGSPGFWIFQKEKNSKQLMFGKMPGAATAAMNKERGTVFPHFITAPFSFSVGFAPPKISF